MAADNSVTELHAQFSSPAATVTPWAEAVEVLEKAGDELEAGRWTECHPNSDGAVQIHDGRRDELGEGVIEGGDALPISVLRLLEVGQPAADEQLVPAGAVLLEQDRLTRSVGPRARPPRLDPHQRWGGFFVPAILNR